MDIPPFGHDPVLVDEVLQSLDPRSGQTVVDCTLGRGGHAAAMGRRLGAEGLLIGLDADPRNLEFAAGRLGDLPCRKRFFHANFAELDEVLGEVGIDQVDLILADLGLSTNQLFDPAYGLSFAGEAPLDMRIDPRTEKSAADLVNELGEEELANVLYELAQERYSRRIARKIIEARMVSPIKTTERLAGVVRDAIGRRGGASGRIDPATRTFMALRMAVNQEMSNLASLLERGPRRLAAGGRIGLISFQSMEDRAVKQAFRQAEQAGLVTILTKKPLCPSESEIAQNPRSRSAKLRVAQKR
jgi:16S rRNA (cytosine1402-N4)-methyltransferase